MNLVREVNYILDLQVKQTQEKNYIYQIKYIKELIKIFRLDNSKEIATQ